MQVSFLVLSFVISLTWKVRVSEAWFFSFNQNSELDYDAIELYLEKTVRSEDVETNMKQATEWLAKKAGAKRSSFVKALEKFVALQTIASSPDKCSREGFELILANDLGTRKQSHERAPSRRVDRVVQHYALQHARYCHEFYPKLVAARIAADVRPEQAALVTRFTEISRLSQGYISWREREEEECDEIIPDIEAKLLESLPIYRAIEQMSANDPDTKYLKRVPSELSGKKEVYPAKILSLFNKYIYEPCKEFDEKVGLEYFNPVSFDLRIQLDVLGTMKCKDILANRISFGICNFIVNNKKYRELAVERLIEIAKLYK